MRIVTPQGQLDLPEDFNITMERTNPLLSDQGDRSIPVTLPASRHNLAILGHKERLDNAYRFANKMDAIMYVGPIQKRGQLVIDSVQRHGGIDAVFAIDNSDLYVTSKNKSLKEILKDVSQTWASVEASIDDMQDVFDGDETKDYRLFPVAVSPYENGGVTVYEVNNERAPDTTLVWRARTVHEGDIDMAVPAGYGVTPFLKLHVLIDRLFSELGYTVTYNCFDDSSGTNKLAKLTIVHNCSDCLCTGTLHYADLVPSCTLSEFLGWLLAKFHAATVVNSQDHTVQVVLMESRINTPPSINITDRLDGDPKIVMAPTRRVVLKPNITLEGTEPAAESFDELVAKYGGYVAATEEQFQGLTGQSPAFTDCLVMRKSTGMFYLITYNVTTGQRNLELLGSNYFTYDRNNSDETEEFAQDDVMPLMLCGVRSKLDVMPYIGDRLHYHTYVKEDPDKEKSDEQPIIVVQAVYNANFDNPVTGTTQRYIPLTTPVGSGITLDYGLANFDMYNTFWMQYNTLLRNNAVRVSGKARLSLPEFLGLDMSGNVHCKSQHLMLVSCSASVGEKTGLADMELLLVKLFSDGQVDLPVNPIASNGLTWQVSDNGEEIARTLFADNQQAIEEDALEGYGESWDVFADPTLEGYSVSFGQTSLSPGMPMFLGETKVIPITATVTVEYQAELYDTQYPDTRHVFVNKSLDFPNQLVTFTFVAVAAS